MRFRNLLVIALASALSLVGAEPGGAEPVLVPIHRATGEVELRSGEVTRPQLVVECDSSRARLLLDLGSRVHRPHPPEPLTGRIVVEWSAKGGEVPPFEQRVGWSAVRSFGLFFAPDSSEWIDSLQAARRLTFYPDSMGELRRPVHFDFDSVGWRPLGVRCAEVPFPSPSSPAGPEFGEYVPVDELPVAIEKPQCRAAVDGRGEKLAGSVVVHALVSAEGRVDRWKVVTSVPGLEEAAVACVRGYRFKPARKGGIPVAVWVAIPMRYSGK